MSVVEPGSGHRRVRERRRGGLVRAALVVLLAVLAFLLGIAFARTLDERPSQGSTVTTVRILSPVSEEARTVTVTATAP